VQNISLIRYLNDESLNSLVFRQTVGQTLNITDLKSITIVSVRDEMPSSAVHSSSLSLPCILIDYNIFLVLGAYPEIDPVFTAIEIFNCVNPILTNAIANGEFTRTLAKFSINSGGSSLKFSTVTSNPILTYTEKVSTKEISEPRGHDINLAYIVGPVIGGCAVIALIAIILYRRRLHYRVFARQESFIQQQIEREGSATIFITQIVYLNDSFTHIKILWS